MLFETEKNYKSEGGALINAPFFILTFRPTFFQASLKDR